MKYQAVVFDMDGVLIDSKECMSLCWLKVQEKTGITIEFSNYFSKIDGNTRPQTFDLLN